MNPATLKSEAERLERHADQLGGTFGAGLSHVAASFRNLAAADESESEPPIVASVDAAIADAVERRKAALSSATTILTLSRSGGQGFGNAALDETALMALADRIDGWLAGEHQHPSTPIESFNAFGKPTLVIIGSERTKAHREVEAIALIARHLEETEGRAWASLEGRAAAIVEALLATDG